MDADRHILSGPNPFDNTIVHNAWEPLRDDVAVIHSAARALMLQAVEACAATRDSRGLLVTGGAGTGKTHLLRWLREELGARALFAYVKPFQYPHRCFRHILRAVMVALARPQRPGEPRQVELLVGSILGPLDPATDPPARLARLRADAAGGPASIDAAVRARADGLSDADPELDRRFLRVLLQAAVPERARLAVDWLRGEALDGEDLRALGVGAPLIDAAAPPEAAEEQARDALEQLGRLAAGVLPLVVCFDQLESMGSTAGQRGADALTRAICMLHMTPGFVLVTSMETTYWRSHFEKGLLASHHARVAEDQVRLQGIQRPEAERLVAARMGRLWPEGAAPPSPTYPFGRGFFQAMGEDRIEVRALLAACRREVAALKARGAVRPIEAPGADEVDPALETLDYAVASFWAGALRSADLEQPELEDESVERALLAALEAAARSGRPLGPLRVAAPGRSTHKGIGLHVEAGGERLGVTALGSPSHQRVAASLRAQLQALDEGLLTRAFGLRRDELRSTWVKVGALAERLAAQGGGLLRLEDRDEVLLAAITRLLDGAVQGDLTCRGERVEPQAALDAALGQGLLDALPLAGAIAARLEAQAARKPAARKPAARKSKPGTGKAASKKAAKRKGAGKRKASRAAGPGREPDEGSAPSPPAALEAELLSVLERFPMANAEVIEEQLRRAFPAIDRAAVLEAAQALRGRGLVRVLSAGGAAPIFSRADR